MFARHPVLSVVALSLVLAGAGAPAEVAIAASGTVRERFAQPDQTVEYHFMIQVGALSEADLAAAYQARIVEALKVVADVGPLGKCAPGVYVDSRGRGLGGHGLIVRVRDGQITIKARAASPTALLDLESCTSRKYEVDHFGTPDYSISSEIGLSAGELDVRLPALTPATVWDAIERTCPGVWRQIRPAVEGSGRMEIPCVAHMYGAKAALKHPAGTKVKEAGVAVWFFPPTDRFLVELAFTGHVRDRAEMDSMYAELGARLRAAGLLGSDQSSKTRQYFAAYFGPGKHVRSRGGARSREPVRVH